jgi:hypothetical protein
VSPWKVPSFDSNGPLCCFVLRREHVTLAFLRGAALPDPEKLLEGMARFVRKHKAAEHGRREKAWSEEVDCRSDEAE